MRKRSGSRVIGGGRRRIESVEQRAGDEDIVLRLSGTWAERNWRTGTGESGYGGGGWN